MIFIECSGKKIPALGFGTWKLKGDECRISVRKALEMGYRHIDTAQIYENENEVGDAIRDSGIARGDIFLTTKVWVTNMRKGDLRKSVAESLKKLKTDYVDLLLLHWPNKDVSLEEQLDALQEVKTSGLARLIGVSNYPVALMTRAIEEIGAPISNNQVEYHPYLSQWPVLDYARSQHMFVTAYTPLAKGKINNDPALKNIAEAHNKTIGQVTLRWLVQQGNVAAIPKAAQEAHMRENFDIFDFTLSEREMEEIHGLARPDGRLVNPDFAPVWDS